MNAKLSVWITCLGVFALLNENSVAGPQPEPTLGARMDYGPFLSYSVLKPREREAATKPAGKSVIKKSATKPTATKPSGANPLPPWKAGELLATKGITFKLGNDAAI